MSAIQAFWINEVGYGDYIWHSGENKVTITETNIVMDTYGGPMTDADFVTPQNWRTTKRRSFWAKDNMLGPFRTKVEAETVVSDIIAGKEKKLQEEIKKLNSELVNLQHYKLTYDKYEPRQP